MSFPGPFPNTQGSNNRRAKITDAQALHIRHCALNGVPRDSLAALFGIAKSTVHNIVNDHYWKYRKTGNVLKKS